MFISIYKIKFFQVKQDFSFLRSDTIKIIIKNIFINHL